MRKYRKLIAALVLALSLSANTLARDGIIYTGIAAPSPTPTATASAANIDPADGEGIIQADSASAVTDAADAVAEIALSLLQSVLTLF